MINRKLTGEKELSLMDKSRMSKKEIKKCNDCMGTIQHMMTDVEKKKIKITGLRTREHVFI